MVVCCLGISVFYIRFNVMLRRGLVSYLFSHVVAHVYLIAAINQSLAVSMIIRYLLTVLAMHCTDLKADTPFLKLPILDI